MTAAATLLDSRYLLGEEIGSGGFCGVWRATDTVLGRPVAVKLLHARYAHQPEARARLKAEARQAGGLAHENIARVYDYGEPACGQPYLVMELIDGPALTTVLADGPLEAARAMDIVAQVADGLQAAHSAGLVHRDIKPANILLTSAGNARITDFGIAHAVGSAPLTATGTVMGTAGYLAPERVAGAQGGPASDLYALGIVAFECLAGAPPFSGPPLEVAIAHRDRPLPPLPASLPAEVAKFVMALTAKDPAGRPGSAREVGCQARRLRDCLVSGAIGARPTPAGALPAITSATGSRGRGALRGQVPVNDIAGRVPARWPPTFPHPGRPHPGRHCQRRRGSQPHTRPAPHPAPRPPRPQEPQPRPRATAPLISRDTRKHRPRCRVSLPDYIGL